MENASKALIIAGAILLAILIISLGILVYNQASETVDQANLDSQEMQTFNAQFIDYEGTTSAATVRSLISLINSSNYSEKTSGRGLYVTLNGNTTTEGTTSTTRGSYVEDVGTYITVSDTKTYTITIQYYNGVVCNISVKGS